MYYCLKQSWLAKNLLETQGKSVSGPLLRNHGPPLSFRAPAGRRRGKGSQCKISWYQPVLERRLECFRLINIHQLAYRHQSCDVLGRNFQQYLLTTSSFSYIKLSWERMQRRAPGQENFQKSLGHFIVETMNSVTGQCVLS